MSKPIAKGRLSTLEKHSHPEAEHLHNTLPYRYFNDETGLFENQSSLGFGKKLNVLGGANDDLVMALNDLVCRLPEGDKWDYQFVLTGDNQVGHFIDANTQTPPNAVALWRLSLKIRPFMRTMPHGMASIPAWAPLADLI